VAIEILAKIGYHVVAITGKPEETHYLKTLGAKEILQRQSIDLTRIRPLDKATWAGVVDNLGGDILAWLLSTMMIGGTVGAVGLAADMKLNTTVAPFILAASRSARTAPTAPWRCARRSGTSSPSNGGRTRCTTRCAPSTSTSCRRTSTRI
jgi:NADPH:quinone reductase-like Zn-dependent oxidoreductase